MDQVGSENGKWDLKIYNLFSLISLSSDQSCDLRPLHYVIKK